MIGSMVGSTSDFQIRAEPTMKPHTHAQDATPSSGSAIDPVCGMTVDPNATAHRFPHQGRTYYFCSGGCRTKFASDPAKYLTANAGGRRSAEVGAPAAEEAPAGAVYTCPMHPEIRR